MIIDVFLLFKEQNKVVRAGRAYLQWCSTAGTLPALQFEKGGALWFQGRNRSGSKTVRPWLNPVQPDLIEGWVTGTFPPVTSACPGQGTAGATSSRAKLFLVPPGWAHRNRGGTKMGLTAQGTSLPRWTKPGKVGIREKNQQHILLRVQDITNAFRKWI